MEPFRTLAGAAAPLDAPNVDTDQILPARFLRKPRSEGYGRFLFHDLRFDANGGERGDFVLNQPGFREAVILVANVNFGGGSSRENAPWGLVDHGIRCVVAPSFGEIFSFNAIKNGLLPIRLESELCARWRAELHAAPGTSMNVDLPAQSVTGPSGETCRFEIDPYRKASLIEGLDEVGMTLKLDPAITAFERGYRQRFDWLFRT